MWRDTARRAMFLFVDARCWLPLLLFALHMRMWTFYLSLGFLITAGILERFGLTPEVAIRLGLSRLAQWLAGGFRPAH